MAYDNEYGAFRIDYDKELCEGAFTVTVSDGTGTMAVATFTDANPVHNVNFANSALPSGVSITIACTITNPAGQPNRTEDVTFPSPGPSSDIGCKPHTACTYSGYPASVTVGSDIYDLTGTSPPSGFTTGVAGGYPTVTATYKKQEDLPRVATTLSLEIAPDEVILGCDDPVVLTATLLTADEDPVGGATVEFFVHGESVGTADTAPGGVATLGYVPSSLGAGPHNVMASFDEAEIGGTTYLESSGDVATLNVIYAFIGLLSPYQPWPSAYKVSSSIPLKWRYGNCDNQPVNSAAAKPSIEIKPWVLGDSPLHGDPITPLEDPGSSGLRYDTLTMTWQFNWQTKNLQPGMYGIWITSGQTGQVNGPFDIVLKE